MSKTNDKEDKEFLMEATILNMVDKLLDSDSEVNNYTATSIDVGDISSVGFEIEEDTYGIRTVKKAKTMKETSIPLSSLYYRQSVKVGIPNMDIFNEPVMSLKKFKSANVPHVKINCSQHGSIKKKLNKNNEHVVALGLISKLGRLDGQLYGNIRGKLSNFIKTQNSTRVLQMALPNTDETILWEMCNEILPEVHQFLTHSYGNYFCQKFYHYVNLSDKLRILHQISKYFVQISNSSVGTYPLQKILESLSHPLEIKMVSEAVSNEEVLGSLCFNKYGVYVIEKVIGSFSESCFPFVYKYLIDNFFPLATSSHGLVALKMSIFKARQPITINKLRDLVIQNFKKLVKHEFGNYVIQFVLEVFFIITYRLGRLITCYPSLGYSLISLQSCLLISTHHV
jgi:hypothetical protein